MVGNQRFQPRTVLERARGQRPRRSFLDCCGGDRACFITISNESRTKRTCVHLLIYEAASVARSLCDIDAATSRARRETVHPYVPWSKAGMLAAHFWRTMETMGVLFRSERPCNQRTSCRQLAARKPLIILRPIA